MPIKTVTDNEIITYTAILTNGARITLLAACDPGTPSELIRQRARNRMNAVCNTKGGEPLTTIIIRREI